VKKAAVHGLTKQQSYRLLRQVAVSLGQPETALSCVSVERFKARLNSIRRSACPRAIQTNLNVQPVDGLNTFHPATGEQFRAGRLITYLQVDRVLQIGASARGCRGGEGMTSPDWVLKPFCNPAQRAIVLSTNPAKQVVAALARSIREAAIGQGCSCGPGNKDWFCQTRDSSPLLRLQEARHPTSLLRFHVLHSRFWVVLRQI